MYSPFQLLKKYIVYWCTASNGKGHGIHSPFVFEFVKKVFRSKKKDARFKLIEQHRKELLSNQQQIDVEDFGAGSRIQKMKTRKISAIASTSLKPRKYAQLLYRMIDFYQPEHVLELGTSLGVTTAYLASSQKKIITIEGSDKVADLAETFLNQHFSNVKLLRGDFAVRLDEALALQPKTDFAFIDGNHRKGPTLAYFHKLLQHIDEHSILVFDDIHWSVEMEEAWEIIQNHPAVTLSIDLFFIGVVFFRKDFLVKQHYTIRY